MRIISAICDCVHHLYEALRFEQRLRELVVLFCNRFAFVWTVVLQPPLRPVGIVDLAEFAKFVEKALQRWVQPCRCSWMQGAGSVCMQDSAAKFGTKQYEANNCDGLGILDH